MKLSSLGTGFCAAAVGLTLAACSDSTGVTTRATVSVLLTDAPAEFIDEALVDIGEVALLGGAGGPVVLTDDGTSGFVNLLDLQGAATTALASMQIEAGTYQQLRLVVEAASVTLAEGYEFTDGSTSRDLVVPSGAQTGIKLNLGAGGPGLDIVPGETVLVVDFDVSESYVIQGNPSTPAGISGVSLQPTLRVSVSDVAGSISGTVSTQVAGVTVEGLVVTAEPVDGTILEPFQTAAATATTDASGAYTLFFLVPGDYDVSVDAGDGLTTTPVTVTVGEAATVAGIDFEIVES